MDRIHLIIKKQYPKTYQYLKNYSELFSKRKSSIYNNKPAFSIFGVGDYSFKPFKVAVSGLYKNPRFSLLLPKDSKPIMLDDTCYFIGFESLEYAKITHFLLNKPETQLFLQSIIFSDSKRSITKEVLMRIDITKIANETNYNDLDCNISINEWMNYLNLVNQKNENQIVMQLS